MQNIVLSSTYPLKIGHSSVWGSVGGGGARRRRGPCEGSLWERSMLRCEKRWFNQGLWASDRLTQRSWGKTYSRRQEKGCYRLLINIRGEGFSRQDLVFAGPSISGGNEDEAELRKKRGHGTCLVKACSRLLWKQPQPHLASPPSIPVPILWLLTASWKLLLPPCPEGGTVSEGWEGLLI